MNRKRFTLALTVFTALSALLLWTVPAQAACLGDSTTMVTATAEQRSQIWAHSFERFLAAHPELTRTQLEAISGAIALATPETFSESQRLLDQNEPSGEDSLRAAIERLEAAFSTDQLGEIFAAQGALQTWLVERAVAPVPYCNCASLGGSCSSSYPPGSTCQTGCFSWSGNGNDYVGICSLATDEPAPN